MLRARPVQCHACPYWNYNNVDSYGDDLCLNPHVLARAKNLGVVQDNERYAFWAVPRLLAWTCCVMSPQDMDVTLPGAHIHLPDTDRPLGTYLHERSGSATSAYHVPALGTSLL
jgi:hypothetical protein